MVVGRFGLQHRKKDNKQIQTSIAFPAVSVYSGLHPEQGSSGGWGLLLYSLSSDLESNHLTRFNNPLWLLRRVAVSQSRRKLVVTSGISPMYRQHSIGYLRPWGGEKEGWKSPGAVSLCIHQVSCFEHLSSFMTQFFLCRHLGG